jgi:tripartite-type tricarboxylate transporter receptor subunit TctC
MITRRRLISAAAATGAAAIPSRALAQTVAPVVRKLTRLIVGYPPGASTDVIARLLIDQMKGYAPTIIIDNRPGTGGRLALEVLKAAPPDGSVMILTPATTIAVYPHIYTPLGYDPLTDFTAVAAVASFSSVLSVGPMVPAAVKTLPDFIAWCRANPAQATYGTTGAGSVLHFAGMMLGKAANPQGRSPGSAGVAAEV